MTKTFSRIPKKTWLQLAMVIALIILGVILARTISDNDVVRSAILQYGYVGIFLLSVVSGFNLIVPIPAVAFMPVYIAAGLSFWPIIFIMSAGMCTADMLAFAAGRAGRHVLTTGRGAKIKTMLENIRKRNELFPIGITAAYASFVPFPNEVITIPLGIMGYPALPVAAALICGNIVFNVFTATGILGIAGSV